MDTIKISEIKPNPFKKQINSGKLNKNQVEKIKANLKEIGFMGIFTCVKIKNKYHLVYGHHRQKAVEEVFGKNYKVGIEIKDYSDDQLLRAMIVENLSQRAGDFREEKNNVVIIENYLNKNPEVLSMLRDSRNIKESRKKMEQMQKATSRDIKKWLDNEKGELLSHDVITQYLNIHHKLDGNLQEEIVKTHDQPKEVRENSLSFVQGVMLSTIEDKKEQKDLAKALKKSRETRVRDQGKLLTEYKKADEDIKKKVRKGELDLVDVPFEKHKKEVGHFDLDRAKIYLEQHIDLRQKLSTLFGEKLFLRKSSPTELEVTYHYILNWIKKDLIPFMKSIEAELKTKSKEEKIIFYDLTERRN